MPHLPLLTFQLLHENPDVHLLCGRDAADYEAWLQGLTTQPDPWENCPDSLQAFKTAVSK